MQQPCLLDRTIQLYTVVKMTYVLTSLIILVCIILLTLR